MYSYKITEKSCRAGLILIGIGLLALITPFTPGSWLILVGLAVLFGKQRTANAVQCILGNRWYKRSGLEKILE